MQHNQLFRPFTHPSSLWTSFFAAAAAKLTTISLREQRRKMDESQGFSAHESNLLRKSTFWNHAPNTSKTARERRNRILSLMPKALASAYRREQADLSRTLKNLPSTLWDSEAEAQLRFEAVQLYDRLEANHV